jgi:hypothetical protein
LRWVATAGMGDDVEDFQRVQTSLGAKRSGLWLDTLSFFRDIPLRQVGRAFYTGKSGGFMNLFH